MSCLEATLEIRKGLHKLSHIFARGGIDRVVMGAQAYHDAGQEALGCAYRLEREMRNIVTHTRKETMCLFAQERSEVDVLEDEFDMPDTAVEVRAFVCKVAYPASRLVSRKHHEAYQERERDEDEDDRCHDS